MFKLSKINESDSDYRIVFYKKSGTTYLRHGAEANLLNFERPQLSQGTSPRLETAINKLGVKYHFKVDANGAEMIPTEGVREDGSLQGHPPP